MARELTTQEKVELVVDLMKDGEEVPLELSHVHFEPGEVLEIEVFDPKQKRMRRLVLDPYSKDQEWREVLN